MALIQDKDGSQELLQAQVQLFFLLESSRGQLPGKLTEQPKEKENYKPVLYSREDDVVDEDVLRCATAAPPQQPWNGGSPLTDGKSTELGSREPPPCAAFVILDLVRATFTFTYSGQIRRPAVSGDGEDEPNSSAELQARRRKWIDAGHPESTAVEEKNHALGFVKSMALKCAMELQIPNTIQHHGAAMTPSELATKIGIHPSKLPRLRRLMRVLTISGIFVVHQAASADEEFVYELAPTTRLLVSNECSTSMFKKAHGLNLWEMADQDGNYNQLINKAMVSDSNFLIDIILRECGDVFLGINSLIDVAGGHGGAARAIAKAFPQMKCTVLDLPHVVAEAPTDDNVSFISGDMFKYIPPADALFLKWIFDDWGDEDCVKILKKCKEAIPPRDAGGKVIIVDMVFGSGPNETVTRETQVLYDLFIMCIEGIEREEFKWKNLFVEAGFSNYKIISVLGVRSVIELYP